MMQPCVYMMASGRNGTLYIGVTANLIARVSQHRAEQIEGFTKKYGVNILVWFEFHETMAEAIAREKAVKNWKRAWKADLIQSSNPYWLDLYPGLVKLGPGVRRDDDPRGLCPANGANPSRH